MGAGEYCDGNARPAIIRSGATQRVCKAGSVAPIPAEGVYYAKLAFRNNACAVRCGNHHCRMVAGEEKMSTPKERFLAGFDKYIKRDGAADLLAWLEATDFYTAPASTRFHGDHEGGLCEHSINVFNQMCRLLRSYPEIKTNGETTAIISLLHDVCKIGCYKTEYRNAKDANGVWQKVPYYAFDEQFAYGNHGGKSVFLISRFIRLTEEEAVAIQCHMGNEDGKYGVSESYRRYPLAWLLHVADEAASFIDERMEATA